MRSVRAAPTGESGFARTLHDVALVGIIRADRTGACVYANERCSELIGVTPEDALGDGWARTLHPDDRDLVLEAVQRTVQEGCPFHREYRVRRPDGTVSWVIGELHAEHDRTGRTTGYLGTITDVSALKNAQAAVRREKELIENIVASSIDGILAYDRDYRYTVWNAAMERISGVAASETLGNCAFDVFPFLEEIGEDWYFCEALEGRDAVARDRPYTVPATGRAGFFEARYTPLRNSQREVVGGLGIIRDITDLKQAQAQLLQASKLAGMGQLGAGIAHELNQPLTGIQLLLGIIRHDEDARIRDIVGELDLISEQVTRMGRIVDNVRGFARESEFRREPTPALKPLDDALMLMAEQLRLADVELVRTIEDGLPPILADAMQLQQVFLNLLSNALHALEACEGPRKLWLGAEQKGAAVEFSVRDSGPGIPTDLLDKIFDPFFTTKAPGQGTGLGLALCDGIIKGHGSEIRIELPEGGGTRFAFQVERSDKSPETTPGIRAEQAHRAARILVADDEKMLRDVIGRWLADLGYGYEVVEDADAAVRSASEGPFDLALVDLRMPRADGRALCSQLRASHPDLPLIVMSGFVTEEENAELTRMGVRTILPKPFTANRLAQALVTALHNADSG